LIVEYGNMLCLQSFEDWHESGLELVLKLTKGMDSDWCDWTMLVPISFFKMSFMLWKIQRFLSDETTDDEAIHEYLRAEIRKELLIKFRDPSSELMASNFRQVCGDGDKIPIAQWREMQLAFCMINHGRLGSNASGRVLGCDVIKLILTQVME